MREKNDSVSYNKDPNTGENPNIILIGAADHQGK